MNTLKNTQIYYKTYHYIETKHIHELSHDFPLVKRVERSPLEGVSSVQVDRGPATDRGLLHLLSGRVQESGEPSVAGCGSVVLAELRVPTGLLQVAVDVVGVKQEHVEVSQDEIEEC